MSASAEATPNGRRHVVIVTEDPLYGELLRYGFAAAGHAATSVTAGPDCSALITRTRPDAVVVDLFMALTDGFKLLHWLRDESGLSLPAVVLTSSEDRTLAVELLVAGARDVLTKPVPFLDIVQSLETSWQPAMGAAADVNLLARRREDRD